MEKLTRLRAEAAGCRACPLWNLGSQTVFGEGREGARVLFIGEQPGDEEDKAGRPFVGPAGRVFAEALEAVGVAREDVYVTNAVKHFKWEPRGKRRIHQKPNASELAACRPWLDAELAAVKPEIIVCLGATASQALLGKKFRVTVDHGKLLETSLAKKVVATLHPSAILRAPDEEARVRMKRELTEDLRVVKAALDAGV